MFKSEVIQLISKLSPEEIKKLSLFLNSPYFNRNKSVILLFDELKKFYPLFQDSSLNKQSLYRAVHDNNVFNDSTLRSLIHQLLVLVERFLIIQKFTSKEFENDYLMLEVLEERSLYGIYNKKIENIRLKLLQSSKSIGPSIFYELYKIENHKYNYSTIHEKIMHKNAVMNLFKTLSQSDEYLSLFYFIELICDFVIETVYCDKYNIPIQVTTLRTIIDSIDMDTFTTAFKSNKFRFIVDIYFILFKVFSNKGDNKYYQQYKKLVNQHTKKLTKNELDYHYTNMIIHNIMLKNSDNENEHYLNELWEIYSIIIKKRLYKYSNTGYLDTQIFRSVLVLGIKLKKYKFIHKLIKIYIKDVYPSDYDNMYNLAHAFYFNAIGENQKSLMYSNKVFLNNFIFKYDIKNLLLKVYFELEYTEQLESSMHSYKEFLRNDKILNETMKRKFKNFIYYLEKLVLWKNGKKNIDIKFEFSKIQKNVYIYEIEWLIGKYENEIKVNKVG